MRFTKMLTTAVITLLMVMSFAGMSFAEEQATAADLRLIKTEGNVTITNDAGVKLPSVANMKLTSGTHIKTDASGYAWLGLDETKFVKLDHSTDANVVKEGKLFKVNLDEGKILFNVTAPLKKDEEMRIHTSTTITGIRGTIGVIGLENGAGSPLTVQILEGQTYNTVVNKETGANMTVAVGAGEEGKLTVPTQEVIDAGTVILQGVITNDSVPGFAVDEMINDPAIAERVAAACPSIDVSLLQGHREEELKKASAATSISKSSGRSSVSGSTGGKKKKKKTETATPSEAEYEKPVVDDKGQQNQEPQDPNPVQKCDKGGKNHNELKYTDLNEQCEKGKDVWVDKETGKIIAYGACPSCQNYVEIHYVSKEAAIQDGVPREKLN